MLAVLQQHEQAVSVRIITFCVARTEFHHGAAARRVHLRGAAVMKAGGRHADSFMSGKPNTPGGFKFVGEHEKLGVKAAQIVKKPPLDQIGAAFGH